MRVTYDAKVDAAYIYLTDYLREANTRVIDHDINLDFDVADRLVGIEVLGASRRLDLDYLRSILEEPGSEDRGWPKLSRELPKLQKQNFPVVTRPQGIKNWIKEIGSDYVVLLSDRSHSGKSRTITRRMLDNADLEYHRKAKRSRIVLALWEIGGYDHLG